MKFAERMDVFEPGVFSELARSKREMMAKGLEVCDLSVGTPDLPPAPHIIQALTLAAEDPKEYIYALDDLPELRLAAARWYARRFEVELDPYSEIISLLGSQEGLAHIALTLCDPGDTVLVPDPGYPIFFGGPRLAGAKLITMPQRKENGFIVDLRDIAQEDARNAKLMIVSYPNNPTGSIAPYDWYDDLIAFAKDYSIAVVHDNAYCELIFTGKPGGSFLSHNGAREVGVEFNSLSKSYSVPGMRLGFCLGNRDIIAAIARLKTNIDYGVFLPIQRAGIAALDGARDNVLLARDTYKSRMDLLIEGLSNTGWRIDPPQGSMFVWARIPQGYDSSLTFARALMNEAQTIVVPGESFGALGAGYVRMALVQGERELRGAIERIRKSGVVK